MAMKQASRHMPVVKVIYWLENQVVLTFLSKLDSSEGPASVIESLQLKNLNKKLNAAPGQFNLSSFDKTDVPRPPLTNKGHGDTDDVSPSQFEDAETSVPGPHSPVVEEKSGKTIVEEGMGVLGKVIEAVGEKIEDLGKIMQGRDIHDADDDNGKEQGLNSPVGKYLFSLPPGQGTLVISFFHVEKLNRPNQADATPDVVKLLNSSPGDFSTSTASFVASMPNWLNGGTNNGTNGQGTHGCPTMPPVQVTDSCNPWKYQLPPQFSLLQDGTGAGVTVFVLDTLPKPDDISSAANDPGNNNSLLASMAQNMVVETSNGGTPAAVPPAIKVNYTTLPDILDFPSPDQPATGKDIYDRLVGFPMPDHGLFVAGIIRDLAPEATIECIRVLNDYGVGNTTVLINALMQIYSRLLSGGDLEGKPVVINMSLVATPANEELEDFGYTLQTILPTREGLLYPFNLLAQQGVVFAASAGNDSDPTNNPMNPNGYRWGTRFPAAFAYPGVSDTGLDTMIPVGAVDSQSIAADYSNYPGANGIATYGGKRPTPNPSDPGTGVPETTIVGVIDAPRGVYSSQLYPALAKEDQAAFHSSSPFDYPEHPRDSPSTWAYWVGTSFATPVISALAARVLQTRQSTDPSVRDIIINAAMQQQTQSTTDWTRLESSYETASGPMILVEQVCEVVYQE